MKLQMVSYGDFGVVVHSLPVKGKIYYYNVFVDNSTTFYQWGLAFLSNDLKSLVTFESDSSIVPLPSTFATDWPSVTQLFGFPISSVTSGEGADFTTLWTIQ